MGVAVFRKDKELHVRWTEEQASMLLANNHEI